VSAARPAPGELEPRTRGRFVLYVEGPRDRDILRAWAFRLSPALAGDIVRSSVILGGRQPDRAVEHFEAVSANASPVRAVCVLDRDDQPSEVLAPGGAPGLEFFTWSRRHIESYLLVRDAIRRSLRAQGADPRVSRALDRHVPAVDDEESLRDIDAKRLLSAQGALARAFGRPLQPGRLAREMFVGELHPDIRVLFDRMRHAMRALDASSLTESTRVD
jgi:hypothetical protein